MVDSNGVPTAGVGLVQMQVLQPLNQQMKELSVSLLLSHLLFSLPSLSPLSLLNIQVHKFAKKGGMKQGKESKPAKKESLPPPQVLHTLCCLVAWR